LIEESSLSLVSQLVIKLVSTISFEHKGEEQSFQA